MIRIFLSAAAASSLVLSSAAAQGGAAFVPDSASTRVNQMALPTAAPARVDLPEGGMAMRMGLRGGRPEVEVMVNGRGPYRFVVETGAPFSIVTPRVAREIGLRTEGEDPQATVDSLRIGGAVLRTMRVSVMEVAPGVEGLLGLNSYRDLLLTVDYPRSELRLSRGTLPAANGRDLLAMTDLDGLWGVEMTVAGRPAMGVIDTQGERGFKITPAEAQALPLAAAPVVTGTASGPGIGTQQMGAARLNGTIRLGDVEFQRPIIHTVPMPPDYPQKEWNIGAEVLREFVVTMDQRSRVLRLARESRGPVAASPPLKGLGFRSAARDGVRTVSQVTAGSGAERAGIRAGDEVVSVDGRAAAGLSGDEWRALANGAAPLRIVLRREGREIAMELTPEVLVQ